MALPQILEGTWEEIKQHEAELTGQRLRVFINPDTKLPALRQEKVAEKTKAKQQPKQLQGHGMFASVLSSENILCGNRRDIENAAEPETGSSPVDAQEKPSVRGKYAFVAGGSEEFAREKQAEIEREDRMQG